MTTVMPEGDRIKKAVAWVDEQRREHPEKPPLAIAGEATLMFDLSPLEADFLEKFACGKAGGC
ncbi:hypothetical protein [Desulfosudis oleivorans]|uniref:Uncharacterized protein n=1 Tax=Desulfosudis oleivorans (strain DSM 6200 / JCM 39069 / Hxd3) TaxID=96561 RepID=A8ZSP7_DESOH|nr:hypothetical protein [Desulfosudis oleivorans]ABW65960.1 conserved hypothetical protein [Desulfosudis oleivorans Hxd3]